MSYDVPATLARTSHSLTIKVGGVIVGLINAWGGAQSRTITPIYEVGEVDSGNPVENMPGNVAGLTLAVSRYDIYKTRMEEAFGTPDLVMLTRQNQPFDVMEVWSFPLGRYHLYPYGAPEAGTPRTISSQTVERFVYQKCWFSNLGRTISATGDRIINVTATLVYTKKLKVSGATSSILAG